MLRKHHNWVWSMLCLQASQLAKEMLYLESIRIGFNQINKLDGYKACLQAWGGGEDVLD